MMKSSVYKLDSSVQFDKPACFFIINTPKLVFNINAKTCVQVVASYFSLSNCIEGLKVLVKSLFGVICNKIPLAPGESWDPQVLKLCLHHPNEVFSVEISVT